MARAAFSFPRASIRWQEVLSRTSEEVTSVHSSSASSSTSLRHQKARWSRWRKSRCHCGWLVREEAVEVEMSVLAAMEEGQEMIQNSAVVGQEVEEIGKVVVVVVACDEEARIRE